MTATQRYVSLAVALVLIGGAIWYLQSGKVGHGGTGLTAGAVTSADGTHSANYDINSKIYPMAMELVQPDGYINIPPTTNASATAPITLSQFVGNSVVLVDFWTYSCINCQRTIPYLNAWYAKYKDYGFVIVGVHTPEFAFEKVQANVEAAVSKFGIKYPVAMDSNYNTWNAYHNQYWPAEYLLDQDGLVREHSIGEGNYQETEQNIQKLLKELAVSKGQDPSKVPTGLVDITSTIEAGSPETYFNYSRNEYLGNGPIGKAGPQTFVLPRDAGKANTLYLGGPWDIGADAAKNTGGATIKYTYTAKDVYLVASSERGNTLEIYVDGKQILEDRGADVDQNGLVQVKEPRLYKLIEHPSQQTHTLEIVIPEAGLQAYTFTFG